MSRSIASLLLLLLLPFTVLGSPLKNHPSPYLAMHAADPVQWREWGPEAVAEARTSGKLLFISSGYFACHWCHVMQRESFSNPAIAKLLNEHYIPVKIDRELNPALDAKLIDFVERVNGNAGWPLNVFVIPDGQPLLGAVYLPPEQFSDLLKNLDQRWKKEQPQLIQMAQQAAEQRSKESSANTTPLPADAAASYPYRLLHQTWQMADELQGGFGEQSKFPSVPQLNALLTLLKRHENEQLRQFLQLTLDHMVQRGLHDHLGGGFFRYTVDPGWEEPHFEKMLYDNAQLATLYFHAAAVLGEPEYWQVGRQTLDFMLRELMDNSGGFISSLSALDGNDVEGGYYLWQQTELQRLLTPAEWQVAQAYWQLSGASHFEAGHLPLGGKTVAATADALERPETEVDALLNSARKKLLTARQQRTLPKDDKRLAGWNGLALSALAMGMRQSAGTRYRDGGDKLSRYLRTTLWDGKTLYRARSGKQQLGDTVLADYAYVATGLLDWYETVGDEEVLQTAHAITQQAWKLFYSETGWRLSRERLLDFGADEAALQDEVLPSPSATLIAVSLRLAELTSDKKLLQQAGAALQRGGRLIEENPFRYASHVILLSTPQAAKKSEEPLIQ